VLRWIPAAAIALLVLDAPFADAQTAVGGIRDAFPAGSIEGRVLDSMQTPVAGAMVSVVGRTTAVATTDREGRFSLRELPYGPYILSVHSRGYWQSRGRTVQHTTSKTSVPEIQLIRAGAEKAPAATKVTPGPSPQGTPTQLAGFGLEAAPDTDVAPVTSAVPRERTDETGDEGETAWRMRHLPRSILKDAAADAIWADNPYFESAAWFGRHATALVPMALFSDLPLSGQVNLMTIESFDRAGELFGTHAARNVAYVSVNTQAAGGAWAVRGAMTQGDLSSWIVAGSYQSIESARHAYELGLSYSTQRYDGDARQRAERRHRPWIRPMDDFAASGDWIRYRLRAIRLSRGIGVVEPAPEHHHPDERLQDEGARIFPRRRARCRRVRTVGHRLVASARAYVLIVCVQRPLHT
jgi:hypothetical protein